MSQPEIQLDAPTTGGPPAAKFPEVGNSVIVGIVDVSDYQQRTIEGTAKTWDNGDPMMGKRVTGLVVESDGCVLKEDDSDRPVIQGDLVSFYCEGSRFFTWKDALKDHGSVVVGDVMKWKFEKTEKASKKGYNDRKIYVAALRHAKMEDGDLKAMCIDAYFKIHNPQPLATDNEDTSKFSFND
jgi:hypothetical protein